MYAEVALRYPKGTVDLKALRQYAVGQSLEIRAVGTNIIVAVAVKRDGFDGADDGSSWLSSLMALRADIASGDERVLYLAWLLGVQHGEVDDDAAEPAHPDGLGDLSPALDSFIEIMGLDGDLVAAAAEGEPKRPAVPPDREIGAWIAGLDTDEQVALLARAARGDGSVGTELMRRFRRQASRRSATRALRTAGALRTRAEELLERRWTIAHAREAKERMRCERERAAARARHLRVLAKRQTGAWQRVNTLIATKRPGDYDAAIALLKDLREISEQKDRLAEITERVRALRDAHAKKPTFLARLRKAGF